MSPCLSPITFTVLCLGSSQGRSAVSKADICSPSDSVAESGDKGVESPVGGGGGGVLASREFRAVEALNPREIRLLITSLMDDITSSGIGDMLRLQEADKQVGQRRGRAYCRCSGLPECPVVFKRYRRG